MASFRKKKKKTQPDDPRLWLGPSLPLDDAVKIPTGWYLLDKIILNGGIQMGIVAEIVSREGGGKTLFCMRVAGNAQKLGYRVAWADAEYYIKPGVPSWFERQGVSYNDLIVFGRRRSGYATLEDTFKDTASLLRASPENPFVVEVNGEKKELWADVVVIDSLAALQPRAVIQALEAGKSLDEAVKIVGERARMIGPLLALLSEIAIQRNKLLLCCNQVRMNFNAGWGGERYRPWGGQELAHRLDLRIALDCGEKLRENGVVVGQKAKCRVFKNRIGANFVSTGTVVPDLHIYYDGRSLGSGSEIVEAAIFYGIIERSGGWYSWGELKAQGKEKLLKAVQESGALDRLEQLVSERTTQDEGTKPIPSSPEPKQSPDETEVDSWVTDVLEDADGEEVL